MAMNSNAGTVNAAYRLADLLQVGFHVPAGNYPQHVRGFDDIDDLDGWRNFVEVANLVRTIDQVLVGMDAIGENADIFRVALPRWYAGALMAKTPWDTTTQHDRKACDDNDVNLLRSLGLFMDAHGGAFVLAEDERRTLSDVLDEAAALLDEGQSDLSPEVRRYLWSLIARARFVLNNIDECGPEAMRQIALELGGALTVQAEQAEGAGDPPRAKRLRAAGRALMIGFMGAAAQGVAGEIASEAIKQIGG